MGEAIETTQHLYPGLLHQNANLLFMLKCRQFVEMVNGTDSEVRGGSGSSNIRSPKSRRGSSSTRSSPSMSPVHLNSSVHAHSSSTLAHQPHSGSNSPSRVIPTTVKPSYSNTASTTTTTTSSQNLNSASTTNTVLTSSMSETEMNATNNVMNGEGHSRSSPHHHNETDMDSTELICDERTISNGTSATNGVCVNGVSSIQDQECDMGLYDLCIFVSKSTYNKILLEKINVPPNTQDHHQHCLLSYISNQISFGLELSWYTLNIWKVQCISQNSKKVSFMIDNISREKNMLKLFTDISALKVYFQVNLYLG